MNKKILSYIACVFMCVAVLSGCSSKEPSKEVTLTGTNVSVYKTEKCSIQNTVTYTGTLSPDESVSVSAKVGATAVSVAVSDGDFVNAGAVLLNLDTTDLTNAYRQTQTAYEQAQLTYNREKALFENGSNLTLANQNYNTAKNTYDRVKKLFDMGGASQVELDNAKSALVSAEENLKTVKSNVSAGFDNAAASLKSAKVALDISSNALNNATITAPISGYVSKCNVTKGQLVSPGIELFQISATNMLNAELNVTESVIPYIKAGDEAVLSVTSANLEDVAGVVTTVNPVKDAMTGLYNVKISVDNSENLIKAGMLCDVSLVLSKKENIIKVPSEALINSGDEYYVYVANGNTAKKVKVSIGISDEEFTEIVKGLTEGEQIVVLGKEYLSEKNNEVNITEEY